MQKKKKRVDGYKNLMSKYGTKKDVSELYRFERDDPVADIELTLNYEENGLFAKIIDIPADDAVSSGFSYGMDNDLENFVNESLDELDFEENASTAIKWSRLYGGALMVMIIDDGRNIDEPVDWDNIHGIDELLVFERQLVTPDYNSIYVYKPDGRRQSKFGKPEFYDVSPVYGSQFRVHESRCLLFKNGTLPQSGSRTEYRFFGMPEYVRIHKAVQETVTSHGNGVKLLDRAVQAIYKMRGLASMLETEDGEDIVLQRLQIIDMAKSIINSIAIDADGEDYDYKMLTFSGVKDIIDSACNMLSAVTNIPQTKLFGRSPAGENSTGESDMENYYTFVNKIQKLNLKNNLGILIDIILAAGTYKGRFMEVPEYKLEFNPLWSLSETEQSAVNQTKAQIELTKAQTAQIYVDMQVLDASEVRNRLASNGEFTINDILDEEDEDWSNINEVPEKGIEESQETLNTALSAEYETDDRDYKKEYREYQGKSEQIHNRSLRNAARKKMGLKVGDPREVDHKTPLSKGGSNSEKNLQVTSRTKNRKKGNKTDERNLDQITPTGCGVIVVKGGKILIGVRKDNGQICGPGGHIEVGETPEEAAIRESREEFGINIAETIPITTISDMPSEYCPSQVFLCTEFYGIPIAFNTEMENARFESIPEIWNYDLFLPFRLALEEFTKQLRDLKENSINVDARWITTEQGKHIEIGENGELLKGHPASIGKGQQIKNEEGKKSDTRKTVDYKAAREYTKQIKGVVTVKGTIMSGVSGHAAYRMKERGYTIEDVKEALTGSGITYPGNKKHPDAECYQYKGARLVVSKRGILITIINI